uniref:Transmembrane protein 107 n=1 Tax=Sinocyclocheilus grahami TaxID=75366 RepID=A0A672S7C2_SINGR
MSVVNSQVPARFLTLVAHLVIVIIIFWSRENSVRACLPLDYTNEEYRLEDTRYDAEVTPLLFLKDILGFLMTTESQDLGLTSHPKDAIGCHASGSVALLFFLFEQWTCSIYWWIFGFCSVIPALYEMVLFVVVFVFKRKPL